MGAVCLKGKSSKNFTPPSVSDSDEPRQHAYCNTWTPVQNTTKIVAYMLYHTVHMIVLMAASLSRYFTPCMVEISSIKPHDTTQSKIMNEWMSMYIFKVWIFSPLTLLTIMHSQSQFCCVSIMSNYGSVCNMCWAFSAPMTLIVNIFWHTRPMTMTKCEVELSLIRIL